MVVGVVVVLVVVLSGFVNEDFVKFSGEVGEEVARVHHHFTLTAVEVLHRVMAPTTEVAGSNRTPHQSAGPASRRSVGRAGGV